MKSKKGFALLEVLIVSITVVVALIFVYAQFRVVENNFDRSINYDKVSSLYKTGHLKNYFEGIGLDCYKAELNSLKIKNMTDCSLIDKKDFCLALYEKLNVKEIYLTKNNLDELKTDINNLGLEESVKDYIKYINYKKNDFVGEHRLIIVFNDESYTTIVINNKLTGGC